MCNHDLALVHKPGRIQALSHTNLSNHWFPDFYFVQTVTPSTKTGCVFMSLLNTTNTRSSKFHVKQSIICYTSPPQTKLHKGIKKAIIDQTIKLVLIFLFRFHTLPQTLYFVSSLQLSYLRQ